MHSGKFYYWLLGQEAKKRCDDPLLLLLPLYSSTFITTMIFEVFDRATWVSTFKNHQKLSGETPLGVSKAVPESPATAPEGPDTAPESTDFTAPQVPAHIHTAGQARRRTRVQNWRRTSSAPGQEGDRSRAGLG